MDELPQVGCAFLQRRPDALPLDCAQLIPLTGGHLCILDVDVLHVIAQNLEDLPVILIAFINHVSGIDNDADVLRVKTVQQPDRRAGTGKDIVMVNFEDHFDAVLLRQLLDGPDVLTGLRDQRRIGFLIFSIGKGRCKDADALHSHTLCRPQHGL